VKRFAAIACLALPGCTLLFPSDRYFTDGGQQPDGGVAMDAAIDARAIDAGPDGGVLAEVPLDEVCDEIQRAACSWFVRCRGTTTCPSPSNPENCDTSPAAVEAGRVRYDALAAARCISLLRDGECQPGPPPIFSAEECFGIFVGDQRFGEECYYQSSYRSDECAEGVCTYESGACPGICAPYRAVGARCDYVGLRCDPNVAVCSDDGSGPVCRAFPTEAGEPCPMGSCGAGLWCVPDESGTLYCIEPGGDGDPCDRIEECMYPFACSGGVCSESVAAGERCWSTESCPAGLRCGSAEEDPNPRCRPTLAEGDRCWDGSLCPDETHCLYDEARAENVCVSLGERGEPCTFGQYCDFDSWCRQTSETETVCEAFVGENGACSDFTGNVPWACRAGLNCMNDGFCHPPGGDGQPCSSLYSHTCRTGFFCEQGTNVCRPPRAEGAVCNPNHPTGSCTTGLYCLCAVGDCYSDTPSDANVCTVQRADGASCAFYYECASGNCSGGVCAPVPMRCSGPR
jgi:hypothetical protein